MTSFRKALEFENPKKEPAIWAQIGIINREKGALIEAEEAYQKAIELSPLEGGLHILMGGILARHTNLCVCI